MRQLSTATLSNQNIASALLVATYTADADRDLLARIFIDQIAGNGDYKFWLEIRRLGAGSYYRSAITTVAVATGITSVFGSTISLSVKNTDVIRAYVQGVAGDTTTPDIVTEWWEREGPDLISDAVWDEVLTGATHNVPTSSGRRLRQIAANIIIDGTVASSTNNSVTLDAGASAVNGSYDPSIITVVNPVTEMAQARMILEYVGATRTATVDRNWKINPDATYTYTITAHPGREHVNEGKPQAATLTTITLNSAASSQDRAYNGQLIFVRSGTGEDQVRIVTDYVGLTKVATVDADWDIIPDANSGYVMLPSQFGHVTTSHFNGTALQQMFTDNTGLDWSGAVDGSVIKEVLDGVPPSSVGASAIWAFANRTLTMTLAQIINALTGAKLSVYRGDTNEINVTLNQDISDYQQLDIFVKNDLEDRDDQSVFWIRKNLSGTADGLKALYDFEQTGGTLVSSWGFITINDATTGDITFTLKANASQHLEPDVHLWYDIQKISATKVKTLSKGLAEVEADVGKTII